MCGHVWSCMVMVTVMYCHGHGHVLSLPGSKTLGQKVLSHFPNCCTGGISHDEKMW